VGTPNTCAEIRRTNAQPGKACVPAASSSGEQGATVELVEHVRRVSNAQLSNVPRRSGRMAGIVAKSPADVEATLLDKDSGSDRFPCALWHSFCLSRSASPLLWQGSTVWSAKNSLAERFSRRAAAHRTASFIFAGWQACGMRAPLWVGPMLEMTRLHEKAFGIVVCGTQIHSPAAFQRLRGR
jgi:hypothetical protein